MFGLMPNGELRQANLKMLFQKAKQYESSNFKGLYNFINFIDRLKLSSGDLGSAKLIGENDNVIRIMSIHKSKGLEFPVVFLSSTGKQFNLMDLNDSVLLHQEMGIGVKYIDYDKQIQYDTLSKASLRSKMLIETLSEEMRILYVALTRAKEKLIITGIKNDYQKDFLKMSEQVERYIKKDGKINTILIKKYKKYLDWILLVYEYEKEKNKKEISLEKITGKNYVGFVMTIPDASKVKLVDGRKSSRGSKLSEIVASNNAIAGINAGGFSDDGGVGAGNLLNTATIMNKTLQYGNKTSRYSFIGLSSDSKLVLGKYIYQEALNHKIESAIEFGPYLIVNGKNQISNSNSGRNST